MRTEYAGLIDDKFIGKNRNPVRLGPSSPRPRRCYLYRPSRQRRSCSEVVCDPDRPDVFETADKVRNEYVIEVKGLVRPRPEGTRNDNLISGGVEVLAQEMKILESFSHTSVPF